MKLTAAEICEAVMALEVGRDLTRAEGERDLYRQCLVEMVEGMDSVDKLPLLRGEIGRVLAEGLEVRTGERIFLRMKRPGIVVGDDFRKGD